MATQSIRDFIVVPSFDEEGREVHPVTLPVDTLEQIEAAQQALRDAGLSQAKVYRGRGPDQITTDTVVFAKG